MNEVTGTTNNVTVDAHANVTKKTLACSISLGVAIIKNMVGASITLPAEQREHQENMVATALFGEITKQ